MKEYNEIELSEEFDFGFTTTSEEVIKKDSDDRATALYDAIIPLLNNLAKDADENPYIHWPDRKNKIEAFKKKLNKIMSGK